MNIVLFVGGYAMFMFLAFVRELELTGKKIEYVDPKDIRSAFYKALFFPVFVLKIIGRFIIYLFALLILIITSYKEILNGILFMLYLRKTV